MLMVDAEVRLSAIHGFGVFSRTAITRGTIVWELAPELDLIFDDARFINHADDPNTDGRRAVREIAAGEEITHPCGRRDLAFGSPRRVGADTVPRMIELLGDPDRDPRLFAAKSLASAGVDAAPAVRALAVALGDEGNLTRYYAAKALSKVGAAAAAAEAELTAALADGDPRLRYYATKALGQIKNLGGAAQDALGVRLADADPEVSAAARLALQRAASRDTSRS